MSVYEKENPAYLRSSMDSMLGQTVTPDEIVLVKDGPLTPVLEETLKHYTHRYGKLIRLVPIEHNVGLGTALRIGLDHCAHEIVARMDSDDISVPHRFEAQMAYMDRHPRIDVLGSWVSEFDVDPDRPHAIRDVATEPDQIRKTSRFRNPMNHMTVMFRKSAVLSAGSYQHFPWFEDYYLWARLLCGPSCLANVPQILVKARAGNAMVGRRRGLAYLRQEFLLQMEFLRIGFINRPVFLINVLCRSMSRMLPQKALSTMYRKCLRLSPLSAP